MDLSDNDTISNEQAKASTETSDRPSTSIWAYKPWWCQPWSIILTGTVAIAGSWLLLHRPWLTGLVTLPVVAWWTLFLVLYPRAMAQPGMLDEYLQATGKQA